MDKKVPCIIIPGFCQSKANIEDADGNTVKKAWPASPDRKDAARRVLPPYLKSVLARKDMGFTDAVCSIFFDILDPMSTDSNGDPRYNLVPVMHMKSMAEFSDSMKGFVRKIAPVERLAASIGEENIFLFSYNAFGKPYSEAERLDEFITFVKDSTKCEKVDVIAYSLGGPLTVAYLDRFGLKNDIRKAFFLVPAFNGSTLTADIFERTVDKNEGYSLLEFIFSKKVSDLFRRVLALVPWDVRYALLYKGLDITVETVLRNSPLMWALVPVERYAPIREKLLSGEDRRLLRETVDEFFEARKHTDKVLLAARDRGMKIFICAGYGRQLIKLSTDRETTSDGIVPLASSSLGALSKPLSECSDESGIDKSKAVFPESTWFIKGLDHVHVASNETVQKLVNDTISGF